MNKTVVVHAKWQYDAALPPPAPARGQAIHSETLTMNERYHLISSVT